MVQFPSITRRSKKYSTDDYKTTIKNMNWPFQFSFSTYGTVFNSESLLIFKSTLGIQSDHIS